MGTAEGRPFTIAFALWLSLAAAALAFQGPFAYVSPDLAFHTGKILRAAEGDFFSDPFSGTKTAYPPAFHLVWAGVNRGLRLSPPGLVSLMTAFCFLGLVLSWFVLARETLGGTEKASLAALALSLLVYAPTTRYVFLANPSNFAWVFLLSGMALGARARHLVCRSAVAGPVLWLLVGLLLSLAANVWWFHAVAALSFGVAVLLPLISRRNLLRVHAPFLLGALLPFAFLAWHIASIHEVLPAYADAPAASQKPLVERLVQAPVWAAIVGIGKGNFQPFGDDRVYWLGDTRLLEGFLAGRRPFGAAVLLNAWQLVHYLLLIVPLAVGLLAVAVTRGRILAKAALDGTDRLLFRAGALVLLLSVPVTLLGNFAHLRRVQFAGWLLLFLFALRRLAKNERWGDRLLRSRVLAGALLVVSALYLLPLAAPVSVAPHTIRAAEGLAARPERRTSRVFASRETARALVPWISFSSFMGYTDGRYYFQDPVSARALREGYEGIVRGRDPEAILRRHGVSLLVFDHRLAADRALAARLRPLGRTVPSDAPWEIVLLDPR